jgi:ribulose-phosphate 3-epimerase
MVAPSLLAADFSNLQREIQMINTSEADWLHLDIMDGVFVPNLSFGIPVVKAVKAHCIKPLDVHLMIVDPDRYVQTFHEAGAHILTVHYEACMHLHRTIENIKDKGMRAGVSLNPHTPVEGLRDILHLLDLVLIMSVNPGFGGQRFIEGSYCKIRRLKDLIQERSSKALIEVDGGVDEDNARLLFDAGTDVLVAGTTIFKSANPQAAIKLLKGS